MDRTYKNFMTNKFRFWALMAFDWTLDPMKYTVFEVSIKFYIKSSPKILKLEIFHMEVKKEPKKRMAATRRNLFLRSKIQK
jgi:hypothetical protein